MLRRLAPALAGMLGLGIILWCSGHARADERKDALRLQYTEFCAVVTPPPAELLAAIEASVKQDPRRWAPSARWMQDLFDAYTKRGCGDA